jgi:hypothetical protein
MSTADFVFRVLGVEAELIRGSAELLPDRELILDLRVKYKARYHVHYDEGPGGLHLSFLESVVEDEQSFKAGVSGEEAARLRAALAASDGREVIREFFDRRLKSGLEASHGAGVERGMQARGVGPGLRAKLELEVRVAKRQKEMEGATK